MFMLFKLLKYVWQTKYKILDPQIEFIIVDYLYFSCHFIFILIYGDLCSFPEVMWLKLSILKLEVGREEIILSKFRRKFPIGMKVSSISSL